tara:strand:- start:523 stop:1401 length:879 start_codon:yes stop_codon:yes gene_type:complete
MISVIIASYNEPNTIGKAIKTFLDEDIEDLEIIVVAPDKPTIDSAKKIKSSSVKAIKEKVKAGKPAALNIAIKNLDKKSDILILSDGDVQIKKGSIKKLIKPFENPKIGAVTGKPVSINSKNNKLGFWSHVLTKTADHRRKKALQNKKRIFCSGYLFAIRKSLFPELNPELLSEDGYISHKVYGKDYRITYSPESEVYIKYPNNFKDWINQKRRSAGGYNQNYKILNAKIRSFSSESKGFFDLFKFTSNPKELFWLLQLFVARVYLWLLIYKDINIKKKNREEIWVPIDSTK